MFNDLFITIAAGVISALPVQPAPAVEVKMDDVKSSVVKYIENKENRKVTLDCSYSLPELSVKEDEPIEFLCTTTDVKNNQKFKTTITLTADDGKLDVSADLSHNSKTPKTTASPTAQPIK